jgi:hypothetical protein
MKHSVKLGLTLLNGLNTGAVSSFIASLLLAVTCLGYESVITYLGSNEWLLIINKEKL